MELQFYEKRANAGPLPVPRTRGIVMRHNISKALIGVVLLAAASTFLASCNTVAGAGKDVSSAGHAVTDTADDVKKK
jgi:predicted small secreted protein